MSKIMKKGNGDEKTKKNLRKNLRKNWESVFFIISD